jgi:hypothetical protein
MTTLHCQRMPAAAVACLFFFLAPISRPYAAAFDEDLAAPPALQPQELSERIREYFAINAAKARMPAGLLRDASSYQKWTDLRWQLWRMLEEGKPLGDLTELGVNDHGEGSFSIDLERFPEWQPLESAAALYGFEWRSWTAPELRKLGFSEEEMQRLKDYLDANDPERAAFIECRPLLEGFLNVVLTRHRAHGSLDPALMESYAYQRTRCRYEAGRVWLVGPFDQLPVRQQELLFTMLDQPKGVFTVRREQELDQRERGYRFVYDAILSGEYARELEKKAKDFGH